MYLKTLTIRGFKSFASKTTFEFEPGVTSVIGPNGSGKSNVVDALAWVMGEQGAKNLRGGKMEDVIFAGTTGRPPLGRAQVELTIDNSDATLPIDFSEVTISRTLFRSGGSEYHINGEPARLLDIQELLSDSGLGREMHVIVGQGQLDRILQATPEERRGFIEEAAGILKHRRRKERSERKLEAMRANLDRIRDLTDEVHRQLGPLSRQANTARKAQRIQHDVRDATARLLADDIVAENLRLQELLDSDGVLEQQHREAQEDLTRLETQAEALRTRHVETTQAATSARDHRYQLTAMAERFRSVRALAAERLKTASRPPVASSGLSPEEAEQQLQNHESTLNQHHGELLRAQEHLQGAEQLREAAEKQARITRETYTQLVRQEADQHKTQAQAESQLSTARLKLDSLQSQLERVEQEHRADASSVIEATDEIRGYEQELEDAEARLDTMLKEQEQARQVVREVQEHFTAAETTVNESNTKLSAAKARVEVLKQSLRPAAGSGLAELMKLEGKDLSEILEVEPGWEKAIASVFAGSTDRLWLENLDVALRGASKLEGQKHSDIRVFYGATAHEHSFDPDIPDTRPISTVISARQDATAVFTILADYVADTLLVEDLHTGIRLVHDQNVFEHQPNLRLVTRAGEVITRAWVELRGSGGVSSLEQRAAYDASVGTIQRLQQTLEDAIADRDTARKALDEKRQASAKLEPLITQLRQEVTALRERIALHHRELKRQQDARERNAAQQTKLKSQVHAAQQVFDTANERYEAVIAASKLSTQNAGGVEEASKTQQIAEQEATTARATETEARLALRTAENAIEQAEQRVEQARRRVSAATIAQQEYQRAIIRQKRMQDRLTELVEAIEIAINQLLQSIARAESDHDELERQRLTFDEELQNTQQQVHRVRKDLERLQEKLHQRSLLRQEHEIKLEQLHERSLNELGYSHEYLVKNFGPDQPVDTGDESTEMVFYDRSEQQKRLRSAKRNLSSLGKVNPLALEEYSAVKERHEYLTQQLEDLETSRKDLLKIIEDVNQTVLQVFSSAYEDTAAQFEHVFATLFPGGEGRLSLTEPDNMLETGIDVEARPAGKKVKRLSLLSGGERSLAAIAMLVSIFKARPSPFYVMDEVEAALDDTNLTRLLTIFKELQADSQLIIITHQKRTMEISDALYGVSMRGDGVSQVISQKLEHH